MLAYLLVTREPCEIVGCFLNLFWVVFNYICVGAIWVGPGPTDTYLSLTWSVSYVAQLEDSMYIKGTWLLLFVCIIISVHCFSHIVCLPVVVRDCMRAWSRRGMWQSVMTRQRELERRLTPELGKLKCILKVSGHVLLCGISATVLLFQYIVSHIYAIWSYFNNFITALFLHICSFWLGRMLLHFQVCTDPMRRHVSPPTEHCLELLQYQWSYNVY